MKDAYSEAIALVRDETEFIDDAQVSSGANIGFSKNAHLNVLIRGSGGVDHLEVLFFAPDSELLPIEMNAILTSTSYVSSCL